MCYSSTPSYPFQRREGIKQGAEIRCEMRGRPPACGVGSNFPKAPSVRGCVEFTHGLLKFHTLSIFSHPTFQELKFHQHKYYAHYRQHAFADGGSQYILGKSFQETARHQSATLVPRCTHKNQPSSHKQHIIHKHLTPLFKNKPICSFVVVLAAI